MASVKLGHSVYDLWLLVWVHYADLVRFLRISCYISCFSVFEARPWASDQHTSLRSSWRLRATQSALRGSIPGSRQQRRYPFPRRIVQSSMFNHRYGINRIFFRIFAQVRTGKALDVCNFFYLFAMVELDRDGRALLLNMNSSASLTLKGYHVWWNITPNQLCSLRV